jgi:multidrug efflux system membrane fusion protein
MQQLSRWLCGFALLSLGLTGCNQQPNDALAAPQAPPMPVKVSQVLEQPVTDFADFTGRTSAVDSVKLRARVWGHLQKIEFTEGADVKKGQVLFVIDQRTYKAALARSDAEVSQTEARFKRLEAEYKRAQNLARKDAISPAEFDKISGDYSEASGALSSAQAMRETAKLNLDFTEVRAPISGQIGRAMITVGNMVESGELGGTVLSSIVSIDPMHVYFDVDDQTFVQIRKRVRDTNSKGKLSVHVALSNDTGFPHTGHLDFVDNQVDPGTGTLRMRAVLPNKDRSLTPGLFVRVRVALGVPRDALLVADRAVDTDQGQKILFVVNSQNVVEKRLVKLGGLHDGLREIQSGVKSGEQVVIDGIQRVRADAVVAPTLIPMPINGNKHNVD